MGVSINDVSMVRETDESVTAPASHAAAVTPDDDTDLAETTRAVWVGGAGNVEVIMAGGGTVVFTAVPAGTLLPIRVTRIKAANTDASSIVAVW